MKRPGSRWFQRKGERRGLGALLLVFALLFPAWSTEAAETVISLQFDDANQSQYQVREMLRERGLHATFFVISTRLGQNNYLTLDQLHELEGDGNEIGGHTLDHQDLTTLSAAEAERQTCEDRAALLQAGFNVTNFAYPYGASNESVQAIVARCGYQSARSIGGVGGCASCPAAESLPPPNRYATRTRASVKSDKTLDELKADVVAAENGGGGWVQFVLHHVCSGGTCPTYSISPSTLAEFLDWLLPRAGRGTVVKTVREALGSDPPPPPPPDTTPPVTGIACGPQGCPDWSSGPVTVTLTASDGGSGVAEIRYTTDGSEPDRTHGDRCEGNPCSFVLSSSATVRFRAWDVAGNAEATRSQEIRIDTGPPVVSMISPAERSIVWGPVTVLAGASDDGGVAEVRFYANGRLLGRSYDEPYQARWDSAAEGPGAQEIHAEATDVAGNITVSGTVTVYVCDSAQGSFADQNQNGFPDTCEGPSFRFLRGDCNGDGQVGGDVTDPAFLLQFNFAGGKDPPCLAACDINGDGRVRGEVSDAIYLLVYTFAGGPTPPPPFPVCGESALSDGLLGCEHPPDTCRPPPPPPPEDTTPPETAIACSPRGCSGWSNQPVTVTLSASDRDSGVAEIRYTTDGSEPSRTDGFSCPGDSCAFLISESVTVRYRAWDLAGNAGAIHRQDFHIDTELPEVELTSPRGLAVVLGTITVEASAADNAGVAAVSFYADGRLIGRSSAPPYQVEWDSGQDGLGTHRLHAEATDLAGNTALSSAVTVVGGL